MNPTTGNQQLCNWHSFSASINQNQLLGKFSRWIGGAWIRLDGGHDQPPSLVATGHQVAPAWRETNLPQYNQLYHVSENTKYKIQNTKTDLTLCTQVYHSKHVSETTIMPEINDTPNQCTIDKIQIHKLFEAFLPQLDTLTKFVSWIFAQMIDAC